MNRSIVTVVALAILAGALPSRGQAAQPAATPAPAANPIPPATLDTLLAPVALYPDALVTQILTCSADPEQVKKVDAWLKANPSLKGTAAQDGASDQGYDAAFVAIVLFPDVLRMMAEKADWTAELGRSFQQDRSGVLGSIQRLRSQAKAQGNLSTNEQQAVESVKTKSGTEVIVIQPANPQVVYVPQYNPQIVYTQPAPPPPPPTASAGSQLAAGLIGFTAGVIIGAAADNDNDHYHYGYGGWGYRGPMLSNDGWNDFAEHREDMAKDYYDHRENMAKQRGENTTARREAGGENQGARQQSRSENQTGRETSRGENQAARTEGRAENTSARGANQGARQESRQTAAQPAAAAQASAGVRGSASGQASQRSYQGKAAAAAPASTSGDRSDAFSGYQKGSSERASSARGNSSVAKSSASGSGGARSGGGRGERSRGGK